MKRSIILFLVSFMITAGIGGGVYYAISQGLIPGVALKGAPGTEVATPTPPEQPADNQPTESREAPPNSSFPGFSEPP